MELLLIVGVICAVIGAVIDGGRGFLLALLLGPIGLVISAILAGNDKR